MWVLVVLGLFSLSLHCRAAYKKFAMNIAFKKECCFVQSYQFSSLSNLNKKLDNCVAKC